MGTVFTTVDTVLLQGPRAVHRQREVIEPPLWDRLIDTVNSNSTVLSEGKV